MDVYVASRLFALLALLTNAATLAGVLLLLRPRARATNAARAYGLAAAAAVTVVATLGSLYYSEIVGYPPCVLCWYQRIFMYSSATILLVAVGRHALRSRSAPGRVPPTDIWRSVVPLAVIGLPISLYHMAVERFPALGTGACELDNPCSAIWVEVFGFVTLPYMAASGFAFVLVVAALVARAVRTQPPTGVPAAEPVDAAV